MLTCVNDAAFPVKVIESKEGLLRHALDERYRQPVLWEMHPELVEIQA